MKNDLNEFRVILIIHWHIYKSTAREIDARFLFVPFFIINPILFVLSFSLSNFLEILLKCCSCMKMKVVLINASLPFNGYQHLR